MFHIDNISVQFILAVQCFILANFFYLKMVTNSAYVVPRLQQNEYITTTVEFVNEVGNREETLRNIVQNFP